MEWLNSVVTYAEAQLGQIHWDERVEGRLPLGLEYYLPRLVAYPTKHQVFQDPKHVQIRIKVL